MFFLITNEAQHAFRPASPAVIPANAGIQTAVADTQAVFWMPAPAPYHDTGFAGMAVRSLCHGDGKQAQAWLSLLGNHHADLFDTQ